MLIHLAALQRHFAAMQAHLAALYVDIAAMPGDIAAMSRYIGTTSVDIAAMYPYAKLMSWRGEGCFRDVAANFLDVAALHRDNAAS